MTKLFLGGIVNSGGILAEARFVAEEEEGKDMILDPPTVVGRRQ